MSEAGASPSDSRFFGRRKGKKLRPGRSGLIETLLPKLSFSLPADERVSFDPLSPFPSSFKEVWLEVGFGGGEHLAGQASKHPDVALIGGEVFLNGIASLLAHLTGTFEDGGGSPELKADNVRIYPDDIRPLVKRLKPSSLSRVFVLFPDPWPKKKHAGRRFIGPEMLPFLARAMKEGAELRVASDDPTYIRWALLHLTESLHFTWNAKSASDWETPPSDWIPTRYEQKAVKAGRLPVYLSLTRNAEKV